MQLKTHNLLLKKNLNGLSDWREYILSATLTAMVLFGFVAYVPSVILSIKEHEWGVLAVDSLIYLWVVLTFVLRQLPYRVRALSVLLVYYLLGICMLFLLGPFGGGPLWLFAFSIMTGILMGLRAALVGLALNVLTLAAIGYAMGMETIVMGAGVVNAVEKWSVVCIIYLGMITVTTIALAFLLHGLEATINREKKVGMVLEKEHRQLQNTHALLKREMAERHGAEQELQRAQHQLIQREKMSAIGNLVAGMTHEISTPVGVGVTASSFLADQVQTMLQSYTAGNLKRKDFEVFMQRLSESATIIYSNLVRAADLIQSLKQVTVDQSNESRRPFNIKSYVEDVLTSLQPKFRQTGHTISVECPGDLEITSDPGVFSQIITNLVMNSMAHAFDGIEKGHMMVAISRNAETLTLHYSDNGVGMAADVVDRIFEPFFTTKRNQGGTGLGLHIVYNLVTQKLNGRITCQSQRHQGAHFYIHVPLTED